jgi:hypothetical protein
MLGLRTHLSARVSTNKSSKLKVNQYAKNQIMATTKVICDRDL